jgi:peptide methionine sulfoxide reductase msrA/msrB
MRALALPFLMTVLVAAVFLLSGCKQQPDSAPMTSTAAGPSTLLVGSAPDRSYSARSYSARTYERPSDAELKAKLEPLEYAVTQRDATEPAFQNRYFNHHEAGLYVDAASGEPLFSSRDKFDSGTGWPSFTRPVEPNRVLTRADHGLGIPRMEVRSRGANSHLGHVFDDGPPPAGVRYCINSAALRFVPAAELAARGYAEYAPIFAGPASAQAPAPPVANSCTEPAGGEQPGCQSSLETAVLAGGCFWGMEDILRKVPGVLQTDVGYTGGTTAAPNYEAVRTGATGHAESVRVVFDPKVLSYADLLERWFFRMHDPTTKDRQGNDRGTQYRSAIFFSGAEQEKTARDVIQRVEASRKWPAPVVTELVAAGSFTPAEDYHQDYLQKNPGGYTCHFCGTDSPVV